MRALSFLLFFLFIPHAYAEEFNAGIVQGLWYAEETVFAEKPTRIYVAIRNNTGSDLTGIVEFFDGQKKIGRKNVQALDGRIIESWTDWTPSYGDHTLKATLIRTELTPIGEGSQEVEVTSAIAENTIFVDYDTDNDGDGNEKDTDDDGDGISDQEEKAAGTDPLVKNQTTKNSDETDSDGDSEDKAEEEVHARPSSDIPEGLERYLSPSPAENVLTSVSTALSEAKQDLDAYRAKRAEEKKTDAAAVTQDETYTNGFGEVSRATSSEHAAIKQLSLSDFFASVWNLAKTLFDWGYTFVLAVLSLILGRPMLVQLGVLVLILFIIMKLASRFGRRPKMKHL